MLGSLETIGQAIQKHPEALKVMLVEMMPELREVSSWHAVGKRRSRKELGAAAERCMSDDVFMDRLD